MSPAPTVHCTLYIKYLYVASHIIHIAVVKKQRGLISLHSAHVVQAMHMIASPFSDLITCSQRLAMYLKSTTAASD